MILFSLLFIKFFIAMVSAYALAIICLVKMGGMNSIYEKFQQIYGEDKLQHTLQIIPR
jgi:hypothetical protein